jgi:hypothetical protein
MAYKGGIRIEVMFTEGQWTAAVYDVEDDVHTLRFSADGPEEGRLLQYALTEASALLQ